MYPGWVIEYSKVSNVIQQTYYDESNSRFFLLALTTSARCEQAKSVDIFTANIPGLTNDNGIYSQLIEGFAENTGYNINLIKIPPKRAEYSFLKSNSGCHMPGNLVNDNPVYLSSNPFGISTVHIITRKDSPTLSKIGQLKGLNLVAVRGWPVPVGVDESRIKWTSSEEQAFKILLARYEVSAGLIWLPDANPYLEKYAVSIDRDSPVDYFTDQIICKNNKENKEFIESLNRYLKANMHIDTQLLLGSD